MKKILALSPLQNVGVFGTSNKENERRLPIHPEHIPAIPKELREHLVFETGYGKSFNIPDQQIAALTSGHVAPRDRLFDEPIQLLPKYTPADSAQMQDGHTIFGWCHFVQGETVTQEAIDKHLTGITFEGMFKWDENGKRSDHTFQKNNEMAGYCGTQHALQLNGITGQYGKPGAAYQVTVISHGSVSKGAIKALKEMGMTTINVYTRRPASAVADKDPSLTYKQLDISTEGRVMVVNEDGTKHPFIADIAASTIIVNGTLQDPNRPIMFVQSDEVNQIKPGAIIIDISCDDRMGFPFARPTSFETPMLTIGEAEGAKAPFSYYAVDHAPTYHWNSATWENSAAMLPYLESVMRGPAGWHQDATIDHATEIENGTIHNKAILEFQHRSENYPYQKAS